MRLLHISLNTTWLISLATTFLLSSSGCPADEPAQTTFSSQTDPGMSGMNSATEMGPTSSSSTGNNVPTTGGTCDPGHLGCACDTGLCLGDLLCQNNLCVEPTGMTGTEETGDSSTSSVTTTDPSTSTSAQTTGMQSSSDTGSETGSSSSDTTGDPEVCGNAMVEGSEECDDGNADDFDECQTDCLLPYCGNGLVQKIISMEQCDDGNADNTDQCTDTCQQAVCGDKFVQPLNEEQCDDGKNGNQQDGCTDLCLAPFCGDGFIQPDNNEQCDDGNKKSNDGCDSTCKWEKKVVFTSSTFSTGKLGGLTGAKNTCKTLAMAAGLQGNFLPWLSVPGVFWPAKEVGGFVKWKGLYVNTNDEDKDGVGEIVAQGWDNLLTFHQSVLTYDENGEVIFNLDPAHYDVWTGTNSKGEPLGSNCQNWTTDDDGFNWPRFGRMDQLDKNWISYYAQACDETAHIYCVQQ